jgi:hypothetical protein
VARRPGLEPGHDRLEGDCSSVELAALPYRPGDSNPASVLGKSQVPVHSGATGIVELALLNRHRCGDVLAREDLNLLPAAYQTAALTR